MRRLRFWGCVAIALSATGCGVTGAIGAQKSAHQAGLQRVELVSYTSCTQLLDQVRAEALAEVGPNGLPSSPPYVDGGFHGMNSGVAVGRSLALSTPDAASSAAGATAQGSSGTPAYSGTNNQEQGVDEPDLVKTDGHLLVTLRQNPVGVQVAVVGDAPRLAGFLPLGDVGSPSGLFLVGNQVVVLATGAGPVPVPSPAPPAGTSPAPVPAIPASPTTDVVVASLADPDRPAVVRSFQLQGSEVDARLIAGRVEVVLAGTPQLPLVSPSGSSTSASEQALSKNRSLIRTSSLQAWLPSVTSEPSGATRTSGCTDVMHPTVASGLDTISVVPIDPGADQPLPAVTVMGDASTVYASTSALYVATPSWPQPASGTVCPGSAASAPGMAASIPAGAGTVSCPNGGPAGSTDIHGFDLSDPAAPRYLGSGEVPGTLIGQYAMSEYNGDLRVATTVGTPTPAPLDGSAPSTPSDNRVTVLAPQGGSLVSVGSAGGLGGGEQIYAVRFIGPIGYVVTFRQTDPLYVLDLSDPTNPRAAGQLELTGYSSFLQPVSGNRLLGIGQSVDQNLRTSGLQVSLFDVSDPNHPALISKLTYPGASSLAEDDPHALLSWAPANLAIMPLTQDGGLVGPSSPAPTPFDGAVAFHIGADGLTETGRLSQPGETPVNPPPCADGTPGGPGVALPCASASTGVATPMVTATAIPSIERTLVVGSMIYSVSAAGIMASDLGTFAQMAWMPYT